MEAEKLIFLLVPYIYNHFQADRTKKPQEHDMKIYWAVLEFPVFLGNKTRTARNPVKLITLLKKYINGQFYPTRSYEHIYRRESAKFGLLFFASRKFTKMRIWKKNNFKGGDRLPLIGHLPSKY